MDVDWWLFGATLFSGLIAAVATIAAVLFSNHLTRKQITDQQIKTNKDNKYVVVVPSLILTSFVQILEELIVTNDYHRMLLFSGDDGFDFFDNSEKQGKYRQRFLKIENQSTNDIKNIVLSTKTVLHNIDTSKKTIYETKNETMLLRSHESILIRIASEEQFLEICEITNKGIGSELAFECMIEYDTFAQQRIQYNYSIKIRDDKRIEILKDGVETVVDYESNTEEKIKQTIFRNLQDSISSIDRSEYAWRKMGSAQLSAILPQIQAMQEQNINMKESNHQQPKDS